jgi:D-alanyl-lipoteichoic acid acyltransferase DltB (MBOAT superfamily)
VVAAFARVYLRLELEPQFHEPYLATSLQDFWGRRWNLMVTSILHPTVYNPVMSISSRLIGRKWAALPGVLASFLVSGIMHEIIFYYIGRKKPTWELTCFFFLHGISLAIEIVIKKAFNGKWQLATVVSRLLTLAFVVATAMWLFMPQVLYADFDVKARRECIAFVNFVKDIITIDSRFKSFITVTEG